MIRKSIPNIITLLNLLSGCVGIILLFSGNPSAAPLFIFIAAGLDFFDGFSAKLLNARTAIGKQLDSLADVVSFGVLPGLIMYQMIALSLDDVFTAFQDKTLTHMLLEGVGLLIILFSALRLAKFNIDEEQGVDFKGLPTPANAILIASLPMAITRDLGISALKIAGSRILPEGIMSIGYSDAEIFVLKWLINPYVLCGLALVLSFLLVSNIRMFSLKLVSYAWKENKLKYGFLIVSLLIFAFFAIGFGYYFIPLAIIIILYIILALINSLFVKNKSNEV